MCTDKYTYSYVEIVNYDYRQTTMNKLIIFYRTVKICYGNVRYLCGFLFYDTVRQISLQIEDFFFYENNFRQQFFNCNDLEVI